jgi:hypothetical protein
LMANHGSWKDGGAQSIIERFSVSRALDGLFDDLRHAVCPDIDPA